MRVRSQALAAKKEIKVMRVPDLLGDRPAGWNASTVSVNMCRFPDRAMMRQLSKVRPRVEGILRVFVSPPCFKPICWYFPRVLAVRFA